jgi:hypothetical protein
VKAGQIDSVVTHPGSSASDLHECTGLAINAGVKIAKRGEQQRNAGGCQQKEIAAEDDYHKPGRYDAVDGERKIHPAEENFVGDGIKIPA